MADRELKLIIKADGSIAIRESGRVKDALGGIEKSAGQVEQKAAGIKSAFSDLGKIAAGLGLARLAKDIFDTNRQMEALRTQLISVTGSSQAAARQFDLLQTFAADTPFELQGLTQAYIRLKSFGLEPTTQIMQAITDQSSKLGASQETLNGIVLALGQAWAKVKLQGEEILQLVERGVPVWDLLAQATGRNAKELAEMSSKGELGRDTILKLIDAMGELASGSNARAMETLNGRISNLSDSWTRFQDTLLNSEKENLIRRMVQNWTAWLDYFDERLARGSGTFGKIEQINDKIVAQKELIEKLRNRGTVGKFFDDLTGTDINLEKNRLDALLKERQRIIREISEQRRQEAAALPTNLAATGGNTPPTTAVGRTAQAARVVRDLGADTVAQLQKEIALFGQVTNVAKFRYELEAGALQDVTPQQKLLIEQYAATLDALQYQKDEYDEFNDIIETGVNLARQQQNEMARAAEATQQNAEQMSEFAKQAARNMQDAFADFLFDPFKDGLDGMLSNFVDILRRMAAEQLASGLFDFAGTALSQAGGFSGLLSSIGVPFFHDGGIVGQGGRTGRVPALAFAHAQRFHNGGFPGLGADEVPAILRRGEVVMTPAQMRAGGAVTVNLNISGVRDSADLRRSAAQIAQAAGNAAARAQRRNG